MDLEERILDFVAREWAVARETLRLETRLGTDLGVAGDDGAELIEAFAREFGVDLTGFDSDRHFGPEAVGCLPFLCIFPDDDPARQRPTGSWIGDADAVARAVAYHRDPRPHHKRLVAGRGDEGRKNPSHADHRGAPTPISPRAIAPSARSHCLGLWPQLKKTC